MRKSFWNFPSPIEVTPRRPRETYCSIKSLVPEINQTKIIALGATPRNYRAINLYAITKKARGIFLKNESGRIRVIQPIKVTTLEINPSIFNLVIALSPDLAPMVT